MATNEQKAVKDWMQKFGQETPEKPTIPSLEVRKLRAKLILEEALETIHAMGLRVWLDKERQINITRISLDEALFDKPNLTLIADGCEDLKVVTEGTLIACGLIENHLPSQNWERELLKEFNDPLFDEVMRSNESKFWNSEDLEEKYPNGLPTGWTTKIVAEHPEVEGVYSLLVKDGDGKIIKSPSFSPPNLASIIKEMEK